MKKLDLTNISRHCQECDKKIELKIRRDLERKKFCSNICKNRYNGRKRFENVDFKNYFMSASNTKESNMKKAHRGENHPLWVKKK